ncbi:hypothetical protein T484DRAFT_1851117 [Baffinella frigidus]|nr:hypothetical protein T484DRAFT_1851117 [Cryptophyta sp. CCMP2293]
MFVVVLSFMAFANIAGTIVSIRDVITTPVPLKIEPEPIEPEPIEPKPMWVLISHVISVVIAVGIAVVIDRVLWNICSTHSSMCNEPGFVKNYDNSDDSGSGNDAGDSESEGGTHPSDYTESEDSSDESESEGGTHPSDYTESEDSSDYTESEGGTHPSDYTESEDSSDESESEDPSDESDSEVSSDDEVDRSLTYKTRRW